MTSSNLHGVSEVQNGGRKGREQHTEKLGRPESRNSSVKVQHKHDKETTNKKAQNKLKQQTKSGQKTTKTKTEHDRKREKIF